MRLPAFCLSRFSLSPVKHAHSAENAGCAEAVCIGAGNAEGSHTSLVLCVILLPVYCLRAVKNATSHHILCGEDMLR